MNQGLKEEIINIAIEMYKNKLELDEHIKFGKSSGMNMKVEQFNNIFGYLAGESGRLYDSFMEKVGELVND